ncbi:hypothetical protein VD0002_g237 [Verticillium dahliae]|uniref:SURF1-like protein n=1 Tax=Verticillium dahliae TaxID=27337 RepID=A0A2J8F9H0_VERDA|nr:ATP-dependent RNA helicase DRS1 [Verticillium dahliae VDG2]KAH6705574.1 surfeit locus protein [Verticillium dahliae]PNH27970.1 hypothetical protein BJF96_g8742 [Verticillium dahliae]PNH51992.1 hypothetical protein VD0003_g5290 [Verticillium dahliae]PNH70410.1 hypothetical protein VD0002_g237 [Verticillium dahliae]
MASPAAPLRLLTRISQGPRCLAPRSNWVFKAQGPMVPRLAASPSTPIRTFRTTPWRLDDNSKKTGPDSDSAGPGEFFSLVDNPATLVRSGGNRSRVGLFFLAIIPVTAFFLGTWQVQRLGWKSELVARLEDRLVREPLPLPPQIDPDAVAEFDYRRVYATGRLRHDREMLIGPRMRDGEQGYMVVTPLERDGDGSTVLVNRGWISKKMGDQRARSAEALPTGEITVEGLLREPWKKNMFTPENRPDKWEFYFPDVKQMAALTGSQPVWIEATMEPEYLRFIELQTQGIPIGRAAEVNLRNNHAQYIFTWYGLCVATSIMLYMVAKKPSSDISRRVRMSKNW